MENRVKKSNLKNVKNINIKMKNDNSIISQLKELYNKNLRKKHIICFIIMTIIFAIVFIYNINLYNSGSLTVPADATGNSLWNAIKENFFMAAVIIFAGITPYFFLSVIGFAEAAVIVNDMILRYAQGSSFLPTLFIGGIIQMIGFSLCIAVGIYYCRLSTKKNKYYHHSDFSFDDMKKQIYEIRKDNKKVEQIEKKKEEKFKKIQDCNVKIPYINFIFLGLIGFIISFVGLLITRI